MPSAAVAAAPPIRSFVEGISAAIVATALDGMPMPGGVRPGPERVWAAFGVIYATNAAHTRDPIRQA